MILYSNLSQVYEYTNIFNSKPVLKLTSLQIKGSIDSTSHQKVIAEFYNINKASVSSKLFLGQLFQEAIKNNFLVQIYGQL